MDGGHCRVWLAGDSNKSQEAMDEVPEDIEGEADRNDFE